MLHTLLFKDVRAEHVKVSQGPFVGLPSLTGVAGLGRQLCLSLCHELELAPADISLDSFLFAYDAYQLHEGFKKGFKPGTPVYEAIPAAWASFNLHLAFRVEANSPEAASALARPDLRELAADLLATLRLCKGSLHPQRSAVNLGAKRLVSLDSDAARVLAILPPRARVLRDRSLVVEDARNAGLPLMETLIAATLRPRDRPQPYQAVFASGDESWQPTVALNGFFYLEDVPTGIAQRADVFGNMLAARAASAAFTIAELQSVAVARTHLVGDVECVADPDVFWKELSFDEGVFLHGTP